MKYPQDGDFSVICREQEIIPLFQGHAAPTSAFCSPWHQANPSLAFCDAPTPLPSLPVPSPEHSLMKESHFDVLFWICVSLHPHPWYITANQAAACLLWLFWEVITLPIRHRVKLIQAIFLIHGLAHSVAIFHVIGYFAIIIVSPFEDSDKWHQDISSN